MEKLTAPTCDGWCEQTGTVTMLDDAGYVYCTPCGLTRRQYRKCRKLRTHELARIHRGQQIERY